MTGKLFIGNLPDQAAGKDVEQFFKRSGRLREISLKNGYGFVEFEDSRDAEDAVKDLNGERLCGERVTIELARGGLDRRSDSPDHRGSGGGHGGGRDGGGSGRSSYWEQDRRRRDRPHRTQYAVWVDNLSTRCSWAELKDIMRRAGEVTYADAHYRSGEGRGEVCYATRDDMDQCLDTMDGFEINQKPIRVSANESNSSGGGGAGSSRRGRSRSRSPRSFHNSRSKPHRTEYALSVENLSSRCDWAELKDFMRQAGEVTYVDAHNRMGRGRGEACFISRDDMYKAKDTLDGKEINGKAIRLSIKDDGKSRGRHSRSSSRSSRSRSRSESR